MSTDTITTADLVTGATPVCARCHQSDRRGLTGWLGFGLCGLCLLIAKARAHYNDEKETTA